MEKIPKNMLFGHLPVLLARHDKEGERETWALFHIVDKVAHALLAHVHLQNRHSHLCNNWIFIVLLCPPDTRRCRTALSSPAWKGAPRRGSSCRWSGCPSSPPCRCSPSLATLTLPSRRPPLCSFPVPFSLGCWIWPLHMLGLSAVEILGDWLCLVFGLKVVSDWRSRLNVVGLVWQQNWGRSDLQDKD